MGVINAAEIAAGGGHISAPVGIAAIGDSIFAGGYDGGAIVDRLPRLGGRFRVVGNFASSGKRSDEILATQVALAVASGARTCLTQFGTNDIAQGVAEATLRANAIAIWTALRAGGVEPVDVSLLPNNVSVGSGAKHVAHNLWRKLYCARNGITHVDAWTKLAAGDGNGGYASGLNYDTLHPNSVAAKIVAGEISTALTTPWLIPPVFMGIDDSLFSSYSTDLKGIVPNAVSFTDTNADGIPNSFLAAAGVGGTYSVQPADSGGFGKWFRCAMTGGTAVGFNITAVTLASVGWAIGDKLAVAFRIRTVDTNQALLVTANFTGITASAFPLFAEQSGTNSGDDMYVYQEVTINGGTVIGFQWVATGTGYFEINAPIIVNLTKLGLA